MKNKLAEITIYFWILKIIATTIGEAAGDMLSMSFSMGYVLSFVLTGGILLILLFLQIRAEKFHSILFWAAIIGTTTVGTEISDMLDRTFHLGYFLGSIILIFLLLSTLYFWHKQDKTLSVYPITKTRSEVMFWISVLISNSLGTAFGDFLTDNMGLSYIVGASVTASIICMVLILHYATKINDVLLFWIAFIFTRPFGATFGDFLTNPYENGGLSFNRVEATLILVMLFSIVLWISHRRHHID